MKDWLKQNGWAIALVVASLIYNYASNGYRLDTLEKRADATDQQIASLNTGSIQTQIALAKIQVDIDYIKLQLNKIVP